MKLKQIIEILDLELLQEADLAREVQGCYLGDLLSNVMARAREDDLWLTVQTHRNVVAVAQLLNLAGIVFLEGHLPKKETLLKAAEEGIPLLATSKSAFQLAGKLYQSGLGQAEQ